MAMNTGMDKYRSMMRRMENMDPSSVVREGENMAVMGNMGGNALTDREVVFNAMKALDPRSVVREGDEMVGRKTGGPADFLTALREADTLTDEQRNILMDMTKDIATNEMRAKDVSPKDVIREGEMMGLSMADREAIEALTTMGISLEDAIEALFNPRSVVREGEMNTGGGALQALPMQRPAMKPERDPFGADRTQSMDMQKEGMGT